MNGNIQKWLDIPIFATLSNKFAINLVLVLFCPPSVKFTQCQTVLCHCLKEPYNNFLKDLWKSSSSHTNIQCDVFKFTKEVCKHFHYNQEDKLQHYLASQGFFFSNVIKHSSTSVNSIWLSAQSHEPNSINNFTIPCINNCLLTCKNVTRQELSLSPDCCFALTLSHSSIIYCGWLSSLP